MDDSSNDPAAVATPAPLAQRLAGEGLGTLLFVLIGCAAITYERSGELEGLGDLTSPTAFGFALIAAMLAFGRLTGGHFNPAVTVGSALSGRTSWSDAGAYIGAQVGGAIVAGILLLLFAITNDQDAFETNLGVSSFGDEGGADLIAALLVEIVLTLLVVLVYLALTDRRNTALLAFAPLGVGLAIAAAYSVAGVSLNPARSIGPALFSGGDPLVQVWLFIVGPLLGAVGAGLLYVPLFGQDGEPVPGSGLNFSSGASGGQAGGYQQQWGQQPGQYGGYDQGGYQAPGQPGGYQAPGQPGGYQAPGQVAPQPPAEQPIIQDGWQWDPQSQQWIPAQQQPGQGGDSTQVRPYDS